MQIKYKPTGIVFDLPETNVRELMKKDKGNYEVLDKKFVPDEEPIIEETTTYNQVVVEVEAPKVKPKAKKKVEE
jgi:hypothetical protein